MSRYDDIIRMPHHVSDRRPQMSMHDRAAQFSPFAALTGYDDAVRETARLTDAKPELAPDELYLLDLRLGILQNSLPLAPEIELTYFKKDARKAGGAAVTQRCTVKRIDGAERRLVLTDGSAVSIGDILALEGDIFRGAED